MLIRFCPRRRGRRTAVASGAEPPVVGGWKASLALLYGVTLAYFTVLGMMTPTLPRYIVDPLDGAGVEVGAAAMTFSVASVLARIPLIWLRDRWHPRVVLTVGCQLLVPAILVLAVLPSMPTVYVSRGIVGASAGLFFTLVTTVVYSVAPRGRHGAALSYLTVSIYLGLLTGPVAGEALRVRFGFTSVWLTAAVVAAATALVTYGIPARSFGDATDGTQGRGRRALLPAGAMLPALLVVLSSLGPAGYSSFVPLYAASIGQRDAALDFAVMAGVTLVVRMATARWLDRMAPRRIAALALAVSAVGLAVPALVPTPTALLAGTALLGAGQACTFPVLVTLAVSRSDPAQRTGLIAVLTACHDLSFGLSGLTLGAVVQFTGFTEAFLVASGASGAGLLMLAADASRVRTVRHTDHPEQGQLTATYPEEEPLHGRYDRHR